MPQSEALQKIISNMETVIAVSYTHLDVYKRQDVYAGSTIEAYLLPLGYGSYTTLLGTSRTAMAAAAAAIR